MYLAEICEKLSPKVEGMEDILTSNVFSFFKYSKRTIFLKSLLDKLGISVDSKELKGAEFNFWPHFEDATEPDLVIIVGDYYLLFEAKLYSGFGEETIDKEEQLIREIKGGLNEAKILGKKFWLIAITEDYYYKKDKFKSIKKYKGLFKWINWQTVAEILLKLVEKYNNKLPNYLFAKDLYKLLEKKNLRTFRSFREIFIADIKDFNESIFYPIKEANFVDIFDGFKYSFLNFPRINKPPDKLFYCKDYFETLKKSYIEPTNNIFFKKGDSYG